MLTFLRTFMVFSELSQSVPEHFSEVPVVVSVVRLPLSLSVILTVTIMLSSQLDFTMFTYRLFDLAISRSRLKLNVGVLETQRWSAGDATLECRKRHVGVSETQR